MASGPLTPNAWDFDLMMTGLLEVVAGILTLYSCTQYSYDSDCFKVLGIISDIFLFILSLCKVMLMSSLVCLHVLVV